MSGYYRVVWRISKELIVYAQSSEDAQEMAENTDCVHDGRYVDDTFEIINAEVLDG